MWGYSSDNGLRSKQCNKHSAWYATGYMQDCRLCGVMSDCMCMNESMLFGSVRAAGSLVKAMYGISFSCMQHDGYLSAPALHWFVHVHAHVSISYCAWVTCKQSTVTHHCMYHLIQYVTISHYFMYRYVYSWGTCKLMYWYVPVAWLLHVPVWQYVSMEGTWPHVPVCAHACGMTTGTCPCMWHDCVYGMRCPWGIHVCTMQSSMPAQAITHLTIQSEVTRDRA